MTLHESGREGASLAVARHRGRAALWPAMAAIAAVVLVACGQPAAEPATGPISRTESEGEVALEQSRRAADALGVELMSTMAAEMARGGSAAAIRVCSEVAQSIANGHSQDGLAVRRVTLKTRNPLNLPDAYERDALERLQGLHGRGELPPEILRGRRARWQSRSTLPPANSNRRALPGLRLGSSVAPFPCKRLCVDDAASPRPLRCAAALPDQPHRDLRCDMAAHPGPAPLPS